MPLLASKRGCGPASPANLGLLVSEPVLSGDPIYLRSTRTYVETSAVFVTSFLSIFLVKWYPNVALEISLLQLSISVGLTPTPVPEQALIGLSQEGERVILGEAPVRDLRSESSQRKARHVKYLDGKDEYIQGFESSFELWTKWDQGLAFSAPVRSPTMLTVVRYPYRGAPGISTDLNLLYL